MAHTEALHRGSSFRRSAIDWRRFLSPEAPTAEARRKILRQRLFIALGALVVLAALGAGAWWVLVAANYVSTDDAYVDATSAIVTPQVDGTIASVPVHDTQRVKRGDILVVIDPADAEIALDQAEANYGQAVRRVQQNTATADAGQALVAAKSADLERAKIDYDRRVALSASGAVSGDEISTARDALLTAQAGLAEAQRQRAAQDALVQGTDVAHNPEVLAAKAALDKARLDLKRTLIRAPVDGVVALNNIQIGQRVQVGANLMTVVPITQAYVNANFKESQLTRVKNGEPVTLTSDLYGSGVVYHGRVVGLGGGTGSAFALIPAQNATGNWIKVVQRLPVRVVLDRSELEKYPLRVGLSMTATVDISKS